MIFKRLTLTTPLLIIFLLSGIAAADVAIIKTAGVTSFDEARNGFASICFEAATDFNLREDLSNQAELATQIKAGNFKLIVAIGGLAAGFAKANFANSPIVFSHVVNPEKSGIKGDNITGVSLGVPVREQFAVLKLLSKKIRRVGVIYTKGGNEALIATARTVAAEQNLVLVTATIVSSIDIQRAMTEIVGKADALWIPPDPSLGSEEVIRYIGTTSLSKQLPCVGPTDRYVRSGAVFSMAADSVEAGRMAGDVANKVLQGTPPSKIPVTEFLKPRMILNLKAAGLLGLSIPKNIQDGASKVYQ